MVRWLAGLVLVGSLLPASPACAQLGDRIVVTGSLIQSDDEYESEVGALPYITITAPADFVMFTASLTTSTRSVDERRRELERTFAALVVRVGRTKGLTVEVGSPGNAAPLETAVAAEAINSYGERSRIDLVMRFAVEPGEKFADVRARAEKFIKDIPVSGRVEAIADDDQFIGVNDPAKHREDLLRKIAADTQLLQTIFAGTSVSAPGISITGLGSRMKTRPVGPLEIEMFIPYSIVLGSPLPQPPPR